MKITTQKGKTLIIDPYLVPMDEVKGNWELTDDRCMVGNINAKVLQKTRKCPAVFGGPIITIQEYAIGWCPLNSQWPVLYRAREDWNAPLMDLSI